MKPDKIGPGWYETGKWRIVRGNKGDCFNLPERGWYAHPVCGTYTQMIDSRIGPFKTLKAALEAVEKHGRD